MMIGETFRTAFRSLAANRLRTGLTMLGMIIGVGAVVAVLAIGEGARASVEGRIRSLGSNLLVIRPGRNTSGAVRAGRVETLVETDAAAIKQIPGVGAVAAECEGGAQIRYRENNMNASVTGVTPAYFGIRALTIASGLGFTDEDGHERRRVAILGSNVADTLFPGRSPLGERIQIRGIVFRVVGVLEAKGASMASPDDLVLVPLATHQGVLFGSNSLSSISVQMVDESQAEVVQARISQLLRLRHRLRDDVDDDFEVRSQTEMLATMDTITGTFTALLGSVAAVSLLVGGIGIMNIMLVSVRERTREIGVRMAVGARRSDVLLQFLVESVVVSLFGGILGLALGYGGAMLIAKLGGWQTIVPPYAAALSLGVSIGIGVVFGVGPARSASKLDPVEALRQE